MWEIFENNAKEKKVKSTSCSKVLAFHGGTTNFAQPFGKSPIPCISNKDLKDLNPAKEQSFEAFHSEAGSFKVNIH